MTARCFVGSLWPLWSVAEKVRWATFRSPILARLACLPRGGHCQFEPDGHSAASCTWAPMSTSGRRAAKGRDTAPRRTALTAPAHSIHPDVAEHLIRYGLDVPSINVRFPPLKKYSLERVKQLTSFLEDELRVDVRRVVTSRPDTLGASPAAIAQRVIFLQTRKVDVVAVANAFPTILQSSVAALQRKFDAIESLGMDAAQAINQEPMILRVGMKKVAAVAPFPQTDKAPGSMLLAQEQFFHSFGLDSSEVFSKLPQLRFITVEKMKAVADYLQKEGVDVKQVLKYERQTLCYRIPVLQEKVSFLRDSGLDAVKHINRRPQLLHYSVIRKLQPILNFVLTDMGRSRRDMDMLPALWSYSLEHRFRPRFFYLKSLGKEDCSLSKMLVYGDQKFTELVAGHNTVHFQTWKDEHFPPTL